MADLLGSILNSMDKPPTIGSQERKMLKKQKEEQEKHAEAEKIKIAKFRERIEKEINEFIRDPSRQKHRFEPMEKKYRSIAYVRHSSKALFAFLLNTYTQSSVTLKSVCYFGNHDVADVAGLTAFSFGIEEVDRYMIVFKKEFAPSDDELGAYRRGEEWDPEKAKEAAKLKELEKQDEVKRKKIQNETVVNPLLKEKYEKRQGREAAKDADKIIVNPNRQFGFVSSENKKDLRSIEQTLADIRAKKKQKVNDNREENI